MKVKAIVSRSTCKTRIPSIRKRPASKEHKGYLKKPEFIKIVDSVKAGYGFVGGSHITNDENKPLIKTKLISCNVAKNVPFTPHKTRTGKVYSRLSTIFAHKLPRLSQLLPPTPQPKKCLNEPNNDKPLKESSIENVIKLPQTVHVVSDIHVVSDTVQPADIVTLVTEEEINKTIENIPNLEDIPQPAALISFNSTFNESFAGTKDAVVEESAVVETNSTEEPVVESAITNTTDKPDGETAVTTTPDKLVVETSETNVAEESLVKLTETNTTDQPVGETAETCVDEGSVVKPAETNTNERDVQTAEIIVNEESVVETAEIIATVEFDVKPAGMNTAEEPVIKIAETNTIDKRVVETSETNFAEESHVKLAETNTAEKFAKIVPKLPDLNLLTHNFASFSTTRKSVTISPDSSPLIPRMNAVKIFQNFKGFTPLVIEPSVVHSYQPSSSLPPNSLDDSVICLSPVPSSSSSVSIALIEEEKRTESPTKIPIKKDRARPIRSSNKHLVVPQKPALEVTDAPSFVASASIEEEKCTEPPTHNEPPLIRTEYPIKLPTQDVVPLKKDLIPPRKSSNKHLVLPQKPAIEVTDAPTFVVSASIEEEKYTEPPTQYEPKKAQVHPRKSSSRKSLYKNNLSPQKPDIEVNDVQPSSSVRIASVEEEKHTESATQYELAIMKNQGRPRRSVAYKHLPNKNVLSSRKPDGEVNDTQPSSSTITSSIEEEKRTESPTELPTQYEPPLKKNRGRPRKMSEYKKSPNKNLSTPPKHAVEEHGTQQCSSGFEIADGKVYTTIKRVGKKKIPLKIEVHSSLLVEPKESCLKKAKNQSWNGEKRFRWADWTKDKELAEYHEFETDEKYSLRKSTKNKRYSDPYGDE